MDHLPPSSEPRPVCYHGGAFFEAVGPRFDSLDRRRSIVNADVLDAWFDPSPGVLEAWHEHGPWIARTSPPTGCEGLIEAIAHARGVDCDHILPGAGSSDLIFRALLHRLTPRSRALILDPTYGEYAHVLERVVGCRVGRLALCRDDGYALDPIQLGDALATGRYDLAVIVNPNSPTGRHVEPGALAEAIDLAPESTLVWIDETYVEYVGAERSLERFAAGRSNVVVCKSMSKVYALSGLRVAYLCAGRALLDPWRTITPPWVVSLPAQIAAVRALRDPAYYLERYRETHVLRAELAGSLGQLGVEVVPGAAANFVLVHLPPAAPTAAEVVARCREHNVFLRDVSSMGPSLGDRAIRVAVKGREDNSRIVAALESVLDGQLPVWSPRRGEGM